MGTSTEQNTLNIRQEGKNKRDHRTEKGPMGTSTEQNTLNIRQEEKNKRDHRTEKGPMGTSIEQKNGSSNIRKDHKKPQRRKIPNVKQSGTLGTREHHKAMTINQMLTKEVPNVT